MKRTSRVLWNVLGSLSFIITCILAAGFIYAVWSVIQPAESNLTAIKEEEELTAAPYEDGEFRLVALGDSLTKGTGDNSGLGYIGQVKQVADGQAREPVFLVNYAVNGYTTGQLLKDLTTGQGDISVVSKADAIVFTIGGNDVFPLNNVAETGIDAEQARANMPQALESLAGILARLREINPQAPIYYVGLYNPFLDVTEVAEETTLFVQEWNQAVEELMRNDTNALLIPTYDLFAYRGTSYLSSDHYHPNGEGYARVAERVVQALEARFGWEEEEA